MVPVVSVQAAPGAYTQHNLVSDVPGAADHTDSDLVNPWGIAFNPNAVVWIANNGTGTSTLYDGDGNKPSLVVTIPGGSPTRIVFNGDVNTLFFTAGPNEEMHGLFGMLQPVAGPM